MDDVMEVYDDVAAVEIINCSKRYKRLLRFRKGRPETAAILSNLNLTVQQRSIYALLGPSGCGKTTLMKCILGRLKINNGSIKIFGKHVDLQGRVTAANIGYMPQDTSIYELLTIAETLQYFGQLHGLSNAVIKQETKILIEILKLPPQNTINKTLSGGQLRRVSFAVSLIHKPKLLIMDEPTVGVDPICAHRMRCYMRYLMKHYSTTIILSTHYIEEARSVDCVGLMQDGTMLLEGSPNYLLNVWNVPSLEQLFFKVYSTYLDSKTSVVNEKTITTEHNFGPDTPSAHQDITDDNSDAFLRQIEEKLNELHPPADDKHPMTSYPQLLRLSAILKKNCISFYRNPIMLTPRREHSKILNAASVFALAANERNNRYNDIHNSNLNCSHYTTSGTTIKRLARLLACTLLFMFCFPAVALTIALMTLSEQMSGLEIGYLNEDAGHLGDMFLNSINEEVIKKIQYYSFDDGYQDTVDGNTFGFIYIQKNFSDAFHQRFIDLNTINAEVFQHELLNVTIDKTNLVIAKEIFIELVEATKILNKGALLKSGYPANRLNSVIQVTYFPEVLVGREQSASIVPLGTLLIVFCAQVGTSVLLLFMEKKSKCFERSLVSGATTFQILMGYVIVNFILIITQVVAVIVATFYIFKMTIIGSIGLATVITVLAGLVGMSIGIFFASISDQLFLIASIGYSMVMILPAISGFFWPVKASPVFFQILCVCLPIYLPSEAMVDVMYRDAGIFHPDVIGGMAFMMAYILVLLFLSAICMNAKSR